MIARLDAINSKPGGWFGENEKSVAPAQRAQEENASKLIREAMQEMHDAQSLHDEGNIDGAREKILRARSRFEAADSVSPMGAKAKISAAIGVLDGLSGGLTKETKKIPEADAFIPGVPDPIIEAIKMGIVQGLQQLNPAEWLTEPDRVFQKWLDIQGLTTPNDVQKFFEEKVVVLPTEDDNKKKSSTK